MSDALIILRAAFPGAGEWHHNAHGSWWNDDLGVEVHAGPPPGEPTARVMAELRVKDAGWVLGFGGDAPTAIMDAILCRIARSAVDYDREKRAAMGAK